MAKPELWEHVLTGRALQGEANAVIGRLCQSILGYARHGPPPNYEYYNCVYVGRTQDLWTRFDRHKTEWRNKGMTLHHMIEAYRTSSYASMVWVEAKMIEWLKSYNISTERFKYVNGKEGDYKKSVVYYLYMLIDDGSKKTSLSDKIDWDQMIHQGLANDSTISGKLINLIKENAKEQKYIYVGFTDDLDRRFKEHQSMYELPLTWSKMIGLFEGGNLHDTYVAEGKLIQFARWKLNKKKEFESVVCLNGKDKHEPGAKQPYSVYVLVGNKK